MIWWDWSTGRRVAALTGMVGVSTAVVLTIGWLFDRSWLRPAVILGGTAFLSIPQLLAWQAFVGLRTGILPARGRVARARQPVTFWCIVAGCVTIAATYIGMLIKVTTDVVRSGG